MCRNIKKLFNYDPPVIDDEVHAAALQYVRKISGFAKPPKANEADFDAAVAEIAPPKDREEEAAKARGAQQLQRTVGRVATDARHEREDRERATRTVALHAPYVLRHYAEIAAAFAAQGVRSARGAISARHDDRHGYHEVEYDAPDLHIRFGLVDGASAPALAHRIRRTGFRDRGGDRSSGNLCEAPGCRLLIRRRAGPR